MPHETTRCLQRHNQHTVQHKNDIAWGGGLTGSESPPKEEEQGDELLVLLNKVPLPLCLSEWREQHEAQHGRRRFVGN